MKIAVISDTHFGDSDCVLSNPENPYFKQLLTELKNNSSGEPYRYLIILGDVLDLAVSNYNKSIEAATPFFTAIKDLFDQIIIIPGNHDHDLWTMVQFQSQIASQQIPAQNEWTASAFLYNKNGTINIQPNPNPGMSYHEGTFLDNVFPNKFIVAAPNIYLIDDDKTILMTHGQYFEFAWAFFSDWTQRAFGKDLNKIPLSKLQHILGDDFLTNQIICSGLGQSEINLTAIIQNLEHDFKAKKYAPVVRYIIQFILSFCKGKDTAKAIVEHRHEIITFVKSVLFSIQLITRGESDLDLLKEMITKELSKIFLPNFLFLKESRASRLAQKIIALLDIPGIVTYYQSSIPAESKGNNQNADRIKNYIDASNEDFSSKPLQYMIFGHTHHPVAWNGGTASVINPTPQNTKEVANCGGWLYKSGTTNMCGANIFIYDSITKSIQDITIK